MQSYVELCEKDVSELGFVKDGVDRRDRRLFVDFIRRDHRDVRSALCATASFR